MSDECDKNSAESEDTLEERHERGVNAGVGEYGRCGADGLYSSTASVAGHPDPQQRSMRLLRDACRTKHAQARACDDH